jgi:hypothetical protein
MKKMIVAGLVSVMTLTAMATKPSPMGGTENPEKYCVKMKNGKKTVMHNGTAITKEETLDNGTKIKPDGTITKSDGTTTTLMEGQCMSKDGMVMKEKGNDKNKDTDKKNGNDKKKNDTYNKDRK